LSGPDFSPSNKHYSLQPTLSFESLQQQRQPLFTRTLSTAIFQSFVFLIPTNFKMFGKSTIFAALSALSLVAAQSPTAPGNGTTSNVLVHVIQVGSANGTLKFFPEVTTAAVGDKIQFQFYPKNHSIAQSSFDSPCNPLAQSATSNTTGFWSGFMPVTAEDPMMPVFTIDVKSTAPTWFYCATGKHCQAGMVGVINPPANNAARTIETYKAGAAKAVANVAPSGQASGSSPTDNTNPSNPSSPAAPSSASSLASGFVGVLVAGLVSLALL
jgi:plastocyanin